MKVLYVDTQLTGHHLTLLRCLYTRVDARPALVLPAPVAEYPDARIVRWPARPGPVSYSKWMRAVARVARAEKADVVHFLYADSWLRFCGLGARGCGCATVATLHVMRPGALRSALARVLCAQMRAVVVHTESIERRLLDAGARNVRRIAYGAGDAELLRAADRDAARRALDLPGSVRVLGALGATRQDKGIDLLLRALADVRGEFHLLIAGAPRDFGEPDIRALCAAYAPRVTLKLHPLSDAEYAQCVAACDAVVLPYRRSFDGASGPLNDAALRGLRVIAPDCGSLGQLVRAHELGYVFAPEDVRSLSRAIESYLAEPEGGFTPKAALFAQSITPEHYARAHEELYRSLLVR